MARNKSVGFYNDEYALLQASAKAWGLSVTNFLRTAANELTKNDTTPLTLPMKSRGRKREKFVAE